MNLLVHMTRAKCEALRQQGYTLSVYNERPKVPGEKHEDDELSVSVELTATLDAVLAAGRMKAALQQRADDLFDAGEHANPETDEVYDSVRLAAEALQSAGGTPLFLTGEPSDALTRAERALRTCALTCQEAFQRDLASFLQGLCVGCFGQKKPGIIFPAAPEGDTSRPWVQACARCRRYRSDGDAAEVLSHYVLREVAYAEAGDGTLRPYFLPAPKPYVTWLGGLLRAVYEPARRKSVPEPAPKCSVGPGRECRGTAVLTMQVYNAYDVASHPYSYCVNHASGAVQHLLKVAPLAIPEVFGFDEPDRRVDQSVVQVLGALDTLGALGAEAAPEVRSATTYLARALRVLGVEPPANGQPDVEFVENLPEAPREEGDVQTRSG